MSKGITREDVAMLQNAGFNAKQIGAIYNVFAEKEEQKKNKEKEPDFYESVMNEIKTLREAVQTANTQHTSMQEPKSTDDILAEILTPKKGDK